MKRFKKRLDQRVDINEQLDHEFELSEANRIEREKIDADYAKMAGLYSVSNYEFDVFFDAVNDHRANDDYFYGDDSYLCPLWCAREHARCISEDLDDSHSYSPW